MECKWEPSLIYVYYIRGLHCIGQAAEYLPRIVLGAFLFVLNFCVLFLGFLNLFSSGKFVK
jgi:hypothetical protein